MCYHAEFGRFAALKRVGINTGELKNWGALGPHPLEVGAWLTPKNKPLPMRYHVKFGSSASNGVCINKWEPQNWGALGPVPL